MAESARQAGEFSDPPRHAGAVAGSPIERLIDRRCAERLLQAGVAAKRVIAALERAGVKVRVFGSLASGRVHPKSDLDLLVLAHRGTSWAETGRIAAHAANGFPLELVFAETLSRERLARLRAASLDARDLKTRALPDESRRSSHPAARR
ncbi:MAG: nucleotidyltransferase domain-containing protein [Betaproteobacteria bacterium]|nr:nucleotidyltransferase domain-containing protein [Betaproteobacteria bacterium]